MTKKGSLAFVGLFMALLTAFTLSDLALAQQASPTTPSGDGKDFITRFDKNKDGAVSKDEFTGPEEVFRKHDKSGDGLIDSQEAPKGFPMMAPGV